MSDICGSLQFLKYDSIISSEIQLHTNETYTIGTDAQSNIRLKVQSIVPEYSIVTTNDNGLVKFLSHEVLDCKINGKPFSGIRYLIPGDIITLLGTKLRYENSALLKEDIDIIHKGNRKMRNSQKMLKQTPNKRYTTVMKRNIIRTSVSLKGSKTPAPKWGGNMYVSGFIEEDIERYPVTPSRNNVDSVCTPRLKKIFNTPQSLGKRKPEQKFRFLQYQEINIKFKDSPSTSKRVEKDKEVNRSKLGSDNEEQLPNFKLRKSHILNINNSRNTSLLEDTTDPGLVDDDEDSENRASSLGKISHNLSVRKKNKIRQQNMSLGNCDKNDAELIEMTPLNVGRTRSTASVTLSGKKNSRFGRLTNISTPINDRRVVNKKHSFTSFVSKTPTRKSILKKQLNDTFTLDNSDLDEGESDIDTTHLPVVKNDQFITRRKSPNSNSTKYSSMSCNNVTNVSSHNFGDYSSDEEEDEIDINNTSKVKIVDSVMTTNTSSNDSESVILAQSLEGYFSDSDDMKDISERSDNRGSPAKRSLGKRRSGKESLRKNRGVKRLRREVESRISVTARKIKKPKISRSGTTAIKKNDIFNVANSKGMTKLLDESGENVSVSSNELDDLEGIKELLDSPDTQENSSNLRRTLNVSNRQKSILNVGDDEGIENISVFSKKSSKNRSLDDIDAQEASFKRMSSTPTVKETGTNMRRTPRTQKQPRRSFVDGHNVGRMNITSNRQNSILNVGDNEEIENMSVSSRKSSRNRSSDNIHVQETSRRSKYQESLERGLDNSNSFKKMPSTPNVTETDTNMRTPRTPKQPKRSFNDSQNVQQNSMLDISDYEGIENISVFSNKSSRNRSSDDIEVQETSRSSKYQESLEHGLGNSNSFKKMPSTPNVKEADTNMRRTPRTPKQPKRSFNYSQNVQQNSMLDISDYEGIENISVFSNKSSRNRLSDDIEVQETSRTSKYQESLERGLGNSNSFKKMPSTPNVKETDTNMRRTPRTPKQPKRSFNDSQNVEQNSMLDISDNEGIENISVFSNKSSRNRLSDDIEVQETSRSSKYQESLEHGLGNSNSFKKMPSTPNVKETDTNMRRTPQPKRSFNESQNAEQNSMLDISDNEGIENISVSSRKSSKNRSSDDIHVQEISRSSKYQESLEHDLGKSNSFKKMSIPKAKETDTNMRRTPRTPKRPKASFDDSQNVEQNSMLDISDNEGTENISVSSKILSKNRSSDDIEVQEKFRRSKYQESLEHGLDKSISFKKMSTPKVKETDANMRRAPRTPKQPKRSFDDSQNVEHNSMLDISDNEGIENISVFSKKSSKNRSSDDIHVQETSRSSKYQASLEHDLDNSNSFKKPSSTPKAKETDTNMRTPRTPKRPKGSFDDSQNVEHNSMLDISDNEGIENISVFSEKASKNHSPDDIEVQETSRRSKYQESLEHGLGNSNSFKKPSSTPKAKETDTNMRRTPRTPKRPKGSFDDSQNVEHNSMLDMSDNEGTENISVSSKILCKNRSSDDIEGQEKSRRSKYQESLEHGLDKSNSFKKMSTPKVKETDANMRRAPRTPKQPKRSFDDSQNVEENSMLDMSDDEGTENISVSSKILSKNRSSDDIEGQEKSRRSKYQESLEHGLDKSNSFKKMSTPKVKETDANMRRAPRTPKQPKRSFDDSQNVEENSMLDISDNEGIENISVFSKRSSKNRSSDDIHVQETSRSSKYQASLEHDLGNSNSFKKPSSTPKTTETDTNMRRTPRTPKRPKGSFDDSQNVEHNSMLDISDNEGTENISVSSKILSKNRSSDDIEVQEKSRRSKYQESLEHGLDKSNSFKKMSTPKVKETDANMRRAPRTPKQPKRSFDDSQNVEHNSMLDISDNEGIENISLSSRKSSKNRSLDDIHVQETSRSSKYQASLEHDLGNSNSFKKPSSTPKAKETDTNMGRTPRTPKRPKGSFDDSQNVEHNSMLDISDNEGIENISVSSRKSSKNRSSDDIHVQETSRSSKYRASLEHDLGNSNSFKKPSSTPKAKETDTNMRRTPRTPKRPKGSFDDSQNVEHNSMLDISDNEGIENISLSSRKSSKNLSSDDIEVQETSRTSKYQESLEHGLDNSNSFKKMSSTPKIKGTGTKMRRTPRTPKRPKGSFDDSLNVEHNSMLDISDNERIENISVSSRKSSKNRSANDIDVQETSNSSKYLESLEHDLDDSNWVKKRYSTPRVKEIETPRTPKQPKTSLDNSQNVEPMNITSNRQNSMLDVSDNEGIENIPISSKKSSDDIDVQETSSSSKYQEPLEHDLDGTNRVKETDTNIRSLRTAKSPKTSRDALLNVERIKTRKVQKSPKNDLSDVRGVRDMFNNRLPKKTPKNDLSHVVGVKKMFSTPKLQKSPANDLTNIAGVKKILATPKQQKSPLNDLRNIKGIRKIMATPRIRKSPRNNLSNIVGVKKMFSTPKVQKSPKNDLRSIRGVKKMLTTPKQQKPPENDLSDVAGVKTLFNSPIRQKSPENNLINIIGVKKMFATPKVQKSPENDLRNVTGVKKIFADHHKQNPPRNDLSDVEGVKKLMKTPNVKKSKSPKNDLTDIRGVKELFHSIENNTKQNEKELDYDGIKEMFEIPDRDPFDVLVNRKAVRTYEAKRVPEKLKNIEKKVDVDEQTVPASVAEWVEDQSRQLTNEETKSPSDAVPAPKKMSTRSKGKKLNVTETTDDNYTQNTKIQTRSTRQTRRNKAEIALNQVENANINESQGRGMRGNKKQDEKVDVNGTDKEETTVKRNQRRGRGRKKVDEDIVENKEDTVIHDESAYSSTATDIKMKDKLDSQTFKDQKVDISGIDKEETTAKRNQRRGRGIKKVDEDIVENKEDTVIHDESAYSSTVTDIKMKDKLDSQTFKDQKVGVSEIDKEETTAKRNQRRGRGKKKVDKEIVENNKDTVVHDDSASHNCSPEHSPIVTDVKMKDKLDSQSLFKNQKVAVSGTDKEETTAKRNQRRGRGKKKTDEEIVETNKDTVIHDESASRNCSPEHSSTVTNIKMKDNSQTLFKDQKVDLSGIDKEETTAKRNERRGRGKKKVDKEIVENNKDAVVHDLASRNCSPEHSPIVTYIKMEDNSLDSQTLLKVPTKEKRKDIKHLISSERHETSTPISKEDTKPENDSVNLTGSKPRTRRNAQNKIDLLNIDAKTEETKPNLRSRRRVLETHNNTNNVSDTEKSLIEEHKKTVPLRGRSRVNKKLPNLSDENEKPNNNIPADKQEVKLNPKKGKSNALNLKGDEINDKADLTKTTRKKRYLFDTEAVIDVERMNIQEYEKNSKNTNPTKESTSKSKRNVKQPKMFENFEVNLQGKSENVNDDNQKTSTRNRKRKIDVEDEPVIRRSKRTNKK